MKIVKVVLALLLCLYVAQDWNASNQFFMVVPGFDVPLWFAIPLAAIFMVGSIADLLRRRPLLRSSSLHRGLQKNRKPESGRESRSTR